MNIYVYVYMNAYERLEKKKKKESEWTPLSEIKKKNKL